jgi:penicillin-binding protein activator
MPLSPLLAVNSTHRLVALAGLAVTAAGVAGCASEAVVTPSGAPAVGMSTDRGAVPVPGVESQDLVNVTDNMARGILGIPRIANAKSTPRIVLEPVANNTGVAIDKDVFLARVRILLNQKAMNRVRFLDEAMMANLERDRQVDFRGTDYFLTGQFDALAPKVSADAGRLVLCSFRLRDAHTNGIVWKGSYEMGEESLAALVALML